MLTLKNLKEMAPQTIFARGTSVDSPGGLFIANTNRVLRWVAVRGLIYDWAIYCHFEENSFENIAQIGNKVISEDNIKKLVPCDDEAFEMYRY